jgi:hypothetical protein
MSLRTIFLAHAEPDHAFARHLTDFLEFGCDVTCYTDEGVIRSGEDIISKAEEGLAADVLVLLLSEASCATGWQRERWEPVLFDQARGANVELATIVLGECNFPALLRRRNFFDATSNRLAAQRRLKRWLWQREREPGNSPSPDFSSDLEDLYAGLADKAGTLEASGPAASRFAREASQDFEAVPWVPCHGRSLAQAAGELAGLLGLVLDGPAEQNCQGIRDLLSRRRCLLVLDAPAPELATALVPQGRSSALLTLDPVLVAQTEESVAYARTLISSRRYAEAYELLYRLLQSGVAPETCARELTWICEHWGRVEEANSLRFHYGPHAFEQLLLF